MKNACWFMAVASAVLSCAGAEPAVSLRDTLLPSALVALPRPDVVIAGRVTDSPEPVVRLRITTSFGRTTQASAPVRDGSFRCRYPTDFQGAPALAPGALFIDALLSEATPVAEATLVLYPPQGLPDLPSAFTCDLLDAAGRTDQACAEWPAVRALANLYLCSRGARQARAGRAGFDLAQPHDLQWLKDNLTLYEFDYRDRDWSAPLNNRPRRTFWQAVWNRWFNASNDHPLDGDPANRSPSNFKPYTFANDFADLLVMNALRLRAATPLDDNLTNIVREAAENLLAMQHRGADNFALPDANGRRETYTAGAFRYGLFEDGEWLTEGKGWFANPKHSDFRGGGVFNGRAVWALGEVLRADPQSPLAPRLREAVERACRFCLRDGAAGGYVKKTPQGHAYWRDPGEHAYLLLGLLAAYESGDSALRDTCADGLHALADLEKPGHLWTRYPNVDAMAVAALAEGAQVLRDAPGAARWRQCAMDVADGWLSARVDPKERAVPTPHFGLRVAPGRMTYVWREGGKPQFFYYQSGHWIHALADLYALTGEPRFLDRAEAIIRDLCGDNPWRVRLFTELGGVYNWTDDTDGDGIEDLLKNDMYPESTAFCQIGIQRLIAASQQRAK